MNLSFIQAFNFSFTYGIVGTSHRLLHGGSPLNNKIPKYVIKVSTRIEGFTEFVLFLLFFKFFVCLFF